MAKFKRGRFSAEEVSVVLNSTATVEELSNVLNRNPDSIKKLLDSHNKVKKNPEEFKVETIPDAPEELPKGYAKKFFEIDDSKNPGKKRKGMAIMTEAGSDAGDQFLKNTEDGLLPMSSKHRDCIAKAQ